jgi:hypothetical protein
MKITKMYVPPKSRYSEVSQGEENIETPIG